MIESEERASNVAAQKAKIRERYKGVDSDILDVIPAKEHPSLYEDTKEMQVGVYARVSTDDPRQTSSYELQKNHYHDVIGQHVGWVLYDIYADEGISGTSLQHRDEFMRMVADCKAHRIDLIVTKSVSRFARNVLDCIGYVRQLKAMNPPIGVFFETENIYTLNENSEMSLSFISTLAQEESHNKSEIMNASIEMRFRRGIFLTPPLLGYDQDENGNLVVNEDESRTVQLIFFLYLYGYSTNEIAKKLTALRCRTKKGNTVWSGSTVFNILTNERYCGDVLARKTFTPNYLNHKSKKNRQDRNQYRHRDHHEAIIQRDDFIATQRMISNAKYRNKDLLPALQVISAGVLRGYVIINPRWAGFSVEDYFQASASVFDNPVQIPSKPFEVQAQSGDFDMRGFEIARSQFFSSGNQKCAVSFTSSQYKFGAACFQKYGKSDFVQMLIHPAEKKLAIRACTKENHQSIKWARNTEDGMVPRVLSGAAFLPKLFELMNWDTKFRYRIQGDKLDNDGAGYLLFDLLEAEAYIPMAEEITEDANALTKPGGRRRKLHAYPMAWVNDFGPGYYNHILDGSAAASEDGEHDASGSAIVPYEAGDRLNVTGPAEISQNIESIVAAIRQEDENAGNDTRGSRFDGGAAGITDTQHSNGE